MQPVQIVLTLADGKVGFQTNATDKVVLLGLLEMGKSLALAQGQGPAGPVSPIRTPSPALARDLLAGTGSRQG